MARLLGVRTSLLLGGLILFSGCGDQRPLIAVAGDMNNAGGGTSAITSPTV